MWVLEQDYVGPDGVARRRFGSSRRSRSSPTRPAPSCRTSGRTRPEGRASAPAAGDARQLEPIFLLYDGAARERPDREPDLEVEGARLWRIDDPSVARAFADQQLLIADGHHRYETAVAFHEEDGTPRARRCSSSSSRRAIPGSRSSPRTASSPSRAPRERRSRRTAAARPEVTRGDTRRLRGSSTAPEGVLDVQLVDTLGHEGISYTPTRTRPSGASATGRPRVAFLLRPTRIEDVFAHAAAAR